MGGKPIASQTYALQLVPKAIQERWTCLQFAKKAGISINPATEILRDARDQIKAQSEEQLADLSVLMSKEAKRARLSQIRRNKDFESLIERKLEELLAKKSLDSKEMATLIQSRDVHWRTTSKVTGIDFAERAAAAKAGANSAAVLINMGSLEQGRDYVVEG